MKKSTFLIVCFSIQYCFAHGASADTSLPFNSYRLDRQSFLSAYGKDDSAKALIQFYFHRRTSGIKFFFRVLFYQIFEA